MQNPIPDTTQGITTPPAASTSSQDGEASFELGSLISHQASLPQAQEMLAPRFDLLVSPSLSLDAGASTLPPLAGPSSFNTPVPDTDRMSGSKRKQEVYEDGDNSYPSNAVGRSRNRKKLKQECLDTSSSMMPRRVRGMADVELPRLESTLPSLENESTHSRRDPSRSPPPISDVPSSLATGAVDLSPPSTPTVRSHSAPPLSPVVVNRSPIKAHHFPPPSSLQPDPEPLHTYSCPICFSSPTNATLTPCGHIMCGECLFTAVGAAAARIGIAALAARCPVCRAPIPKWDGRGGGVIGLQPRVVITI